MKKKMMHATCYESWW